MIQHTRNHRPLLSIVTPTWRAAQWLPRCLASVAELARRLGPGVIEHLCVDGGSLDGTLQLLKVHAAANPGLVTHLSSQRDSGQGEAINRGIFHARGRFGTWLNADDWYEVDGAAAAIARLHETQADVLVGRARLIDAAGSVIWAPTPADPMTLAALLRLRSMWFAGRNIVQPEAFFSLRAFRRVGGVPTDNPFSMDHELWCRLAAAGATFESIDTLIASQLWHADQKTADRVGTVRAVIRSSRAMAERWGTLLGNDRSSVLAELDAMASKLAVVERWLPAWSGATVIGPARRPDSPRIDELLEHAGRAVAGGALDVACIGVEPDTWRGQRNAKAITLNQHGDDRFDLIATSACASDAAIHAIHDRLRPGGVWAQLGEPMPLQPEIGDWLRTRATQRLAADSDEILDARTDPLLRERSPGLSGIDITSRVDALGMNLERVRDGHFGVWSNHPATPFPRPEDAPDVFATWAWQIWRKPLRLA